MKVLSIAVALIVSATMFTSCKTTYIKKFHKAAKKEVGAGKIRLKADTVRVVYPEVAMFDFGKDEIKPDAKTSLERFSGVLKQYDKIGFIINGYTDNVGTHEVNHSLSQKRAENAQTLFRSNGVNADRMQTNGKGEENPIKDNDTEEGRAANRRVELLLFERK